MKKRISLAASVVITLALCWIIGQQLHKEAETEVRNNCLLWEAVSFQGAKETQDNPYNTTAGVIDFEGEGRCAFLTPNTAFDITNSGNSDSLMLGYQIHPSMKEYSDGMGMELWVSNYVGDILYQDTFIVDRNNSWTEYQLDLTPYDSWYHIHIGCSAGISDNEDGDWLILKNNSSWKEYEHKNMWRSAHYFADSYPAAMWDSEFGNIDRQFQKISDDGFNSIILLIPWREFQPEIGNEIVYNEEAFEKLEMIFGKAMEHNLGVILRLGYKWDYYQNRSTDELHDRYWNLFADDAVRSAWLQYCARIYGTAANHQNFYGAFLCWEDYWNNLSRVKDASGNNQESIAMAEATGYTDYLLARYTAEKISELYGVQVSPEAVFIADKDEAAFRLYYQYFDWSLSRLLAETQQVFPRLSMEVRTDDDMQLNYNGNKEYYTHTDTYSCTGSGFSTVMYGIPQGMVNNGETVTWRKALSKTGEILEGICRYTNGKKLFIDQFLFYDNTYGYEHNAKLKENHRNKYIAKSAKVLSQYTAGYGLWAYQDYYFDAIANGEFAKGLDGWEYEKAQAVYARDSNRCLIRRGGSIGQSIKDKNKTYGSDMVCSMDIIPVKDEVSITVTLNGIKKNLEIKQAGRYEASFDTEEWIYVDIAADNDVYIDNVKVYNYCQNGLVYDVNGNELECAKGVRKLNEILAKQDREDAVPAENIWDSQAVSHDYLDSILAKQDEMKSKSQMELTYEGVSETGDNPYGYNAGDIYLEEYGDCCFLTPNTSLTAKGVNGQGTLVVNCRIHPWVSGLSDGAGLIILIQDAGQYEIGRVEQIVDAQDGWQTITVELGQYDKFDSIRILCNNGRNNDDSGDWVVLQMDLQDYRYP